ncbi:OrNV gp005-like protein [Tomelloso virus]|uniref:OrNV gp005-like protein n=1 Tax=Tomelloso virus TaxID=2053981 RepID=A0A2H4T2U9_9VIRU|nr:OrNV gp005-like protein [Tomelloso virus]ATY70247.1 OrNV gp005-like protein [Tomelloso virus]
MASIAYLFDLDGFEVDGKFLVKEMAIGELKTGDIRKYTYKVGKFSDLSAENRRRVAWVTQHIHGLYFDNPIYGYNQSALYDHIDEICKLAEKSNSLIGYKGGHYELDILKELGYQHLGYNIENLKCPKLEVLFTKYPEAFYYQCSDHHKIKNKIKNLTLAHCPQMEVYCFMNYISNL